MTPSQSEELKLCIKIYLRCQALKLIDPETNGNIYWSLLKTYFNFEKNILAAPNLRANIKLRLNLKKKNHGSYDFFSFQCIPYLYVFFV